jgi:hypothetical protein
MCQKVPGKGEACEDRCAEGLRCSSSDVCVELKQDGESCTGNVDCEDYRCVQGKCLDRKPLGAACQDNDECRGDDCLDGTCVLIVQCTPGGEGTLCTDSSQCQPGLACWGAKCIPEANSRGSCEDIGCAPGTYCETTDTPHCAPVKALGERCGDHDECGQGRCNHGFSSTEPMYTCILVPNGSWCLKDEDCASGECDANDHGRTEAAGP